MALTKPPVLPAWAEAGDKVQPSNAEIQAGWPLSNAPPSRQRFNWLLNFLANGIRYLTRRGMPDYGADETYMIGDRVIGDDGKTYRSLQDNNAGNAPSASPLWWERWGFGASELSTELNKLDYKASCRVATTANLAALSGLLTIDGVVLVDGDRVLVKNQTTGSQNGIYTAAAGAWSRATDFDENSEVTAGALVIVEAGTTQADSLWMLTTDNPIAVGGTALVFNQVNGSAIGTPGTYNSITTDAQGRVISGQNFSLQNRIINGDMRIDQRNGGSAVTPTASGYVIDRWQAGVTQASKLTFQRVADAPPGAAFSLKVTVAAQYAPAVGDIFNLNQPIEGNNVTDLQFGSSGALQITTNFYVKSSVTGTFSCAVHNGALDRSYIATYVIAAANTWTPVVLTISGDQTGTWNKGNTTGLWIDFDLGSGTNLNGTAGAWAAGNLKRTAGSVTFVNQVAGATWQLAQVMIERGANSTPVFVPRPMQQEMALCQRYYEDSSSAAQTFTGYVVGAYSYYTTAWFKVRKRATPAITMGYPGGNLGFPASAGSASNVGLDSFIAGHTANATTNNGAFMFTFKADAEL